VTALTRSVLSAWQTPKPHLLRQLAAGKRVVEAADDAAGLGVAEALDTRVRSQRVANRNILDGLSTLSVADGGLSQIADLLKRGRELAVQSSSGTLADHERGYLHDEYVEVLGEIDRIAYTTNWQEQPLLAHASVDVGLVIDVSGSMSGEIAAVKAAIADFKQGFADANLNVRLGLSEMGPDLSDGVTRTVDIGDASFNDELAALSIFGAVPMDPYSAILNVSGVADAPGDNDPDAFGWRPNPERKVLIVVTDAGRETNLIGQGETATVNDMSSSDVEVHTINSTSRNSIFDGVTSVTGGEMWDIGDSSGSGIAAALDGIAASFGTEFGQGDLEVHAGHRADDKIAIGVPADATLQGLGLDDTSVADADDAVAALSALDAALDTVNSARATIGAGMNRLESALRTGETTVAEGTAAASRIVDLDVAQAATDLARAGILEQVRVSMLAQARQIERDSVLGLLSG
jgi:flagellin